VLITFEGGYLKADEVTLCKATKDVEAKGHVFIKSGEDMLEGAEVRFNVASKTGVVFGGKMFFEENHVYLRGTEIEKTGEATYVLKDAEATTCDGEAPDWKFTGKRMKVTIDGYGTIGHGTFQIKNFPIIYVPYMIFPAKTTRQTGFLLPRFAYSSDKLGYDVGIPFYWAVSENSDATFYQRYMDKRGFQEGIEFRYIVGENSFGTFYGDYLEDKMRISGTDDAGSLYRDWDQDHKRWSYYLNHETTFSPGFYVRTDINKVSDNWYFKDFDSYNYYLEHYDKNGDNKFKRVSFEGNKSLPALDSKARIVKDWDLFNVTALACYTDNLQSYSNDGTLQKYPEISFTGIRQPVPGSPFDFKMESFYDYYYRSDGYRGHFFDVHPSFMLPLNLGDYLEFTPALGVRETVWDASHSDGTTEGKRGSREMYDIGATLSTGVQRIFDIGGERVDKIKHEIVPELEYNYVPYVYQDDRADFMENVNDTNLLTYSLTNTLIARLKDKNGKITYREFLNLKLSQAYNIKEARRNLEGSSTERRPFGEVSMELDFNPMQHLSFDADAEFDVNDGEWKQANCRFYIEDLRRDYAAIEYRYTQDYVEEVNLYANIGVTRNIDFNYVLKLNELENGTLETEYGIDYRRQCWGLRLGYSDSSDDREIMVIFSLYGLGKAGKITGGPSR
jgi:LPS-assembly protein